MIDFTTIQTFEVPEAISVLKRENDELSSRNKILQSVIFIGIVFILTSKIIKTLDKDKMSQNKANSDEP